MIGTCTFSLDPLDGVTILPGDTQALLGPTAGKRWAASLVVKGTDTVAAVVELHGSNTPGDDASWTLVDTLSATGENLAVDSYLGLGGWGHVKAVCTTLTGDEPDAVVVVSVCTQ